MLGTLKESHLRAGRPGRVMVAFSGGADSLALLHALAEARAELGIDLCCAHIHHGLRDASDEEARLAAEAAAGLNIPFILKRVQVDRSGNLEAKAREARYSALLAAMCEFKADAIALAHHAQDQAETILMHLMRGAGTQGMAGMREWNPPYWRPFLNVPKPALIQYLNDRQLEWAEDESNSDIRYLRNRLRATVLPLLEQASPGASERIARAGCVIQEEQDDWAARESAWLSENAKHDAPFYFLLLEPFARQSTAFRRRLLRRLCESAGIPLDFSQTEALLAFTGGQPGTSLNLPRGASAFLSARRLHILPDAVKSMKVGWRQARFAPNLAGFGDGKKSQLVDADAIQGAVMRQAQNGDAIRPLGASGTQPLLKYLSARGIDRPFRPFWPVFAKGHEVLWVPGCGVSEQAAIKEHTKARTGLVFLDSLPHEINHTEGKWDDTGLSEQ